MLCDSICWRESAQYVVFLFTRYWLSYQLTYPPHMLWSNKTFRVATESNLNPLPLDSTASIAPPSSMPIKDQSLIYPESNIKQIPPFQSNSATHATPPWNQVISSQDSLKSASAFSNAVTTLISILIFSHAASPEHDGSREERGVTYSAFFFLPKSSLSVVHRLNGFVVFDWVVSSRICWIRVLIYRLPARFSSCTEPDFVHIVKSWCGLAFELLLWIHLRAYK